ncbi:HesA/MoeB/ThiF family protein [Brucella pseudogrignonensis]|uniref:HesA/MoeB/ThiF family protein n=1 Tax=Brucella pseudogrignonensis TaxID=419475 RepID=UPI0038CFA8D3
MTDIVPTPLRHTLYAIKECERTSLKQPWYRDKHRWILEFEACLSVEASEFMPAMSSWFLVVEEKQVRPKISIFPAIDGGIISTFMHQSANVPGPPGTKWKLGNPCIERPEATFNRDLDSDEPSDLEGRLIWYLYRLLSWIDAAATGTLSRQNDYAELPSFGTLSGAVLGFVENIGDLTAWLPRIGSWGYASTGPVRGALRHRQILQYFDADGTTIKRDVVGKEQNNLPVDSIWLMLSRLPVLAPWQAPLTWRELAVCANNDGVNLKDIFLQAGQEMRSKCHPITRLLIGFPFAEKIGTPAERVHWIAAEQIELAGPDSKRDGFRSTENNRVRWDVAKATSTASIRWSRTANWASDQLRTRGEAEAKVRLCQVLLIGAGAVGSAVVENLARLGVRELGVIDGDTVEVGNLSRHTLGLSDCGHLKSSALAARLENCAPDINAVIHLGSFPPTDLKTAAQLRGYDVIIDCTGSDDVLKDISLFNWGSEKIFISLSIGWGAREFFCFCASEVTFPVIDAIERFSQGMSYRPNIGAANREGIGCWHPVFPATADDIQLWGAIGSKFVRSAILQPTRTCKIFRLLQDSTVTVADV